MRETRERIAELAAQLGPIGSTITPKWLGPQTPRSHAGGSGSASRNKRMPSSCRATPEPTGSERAASASSSPLSPTSTPGPAPDVATELHALELTEDGFRQVLHDLVDKEHLSTPGNIILYNKCLRFVTAFKYYESGRLSTVSCV